MFYNLGYLGFRTDEPAQKHYAALDACVGFEIFNKLNTLEKLKCPVTQKTNVNTVVNIYATARTCRGKQLAIGLVVESPQESDCRKCVSIKVLQVFKQDALVPICSHCRPSPHERKTFSALDLEATINVKFEALRTTKIADDTKPATQRQIGTVPTLVLKDAFHLMDSIPVTDKHGTHKVFMSQFRDALFAPSKEDIKKVKEVIVTKLKSTWKKMQEDNPTWIKKRVRRNIPPANQLLPVVKKLLDEYQDVVCNETGRPLFYKACKARAKKNLEAIEKGHVSDPIGVPLYHIKYSDTLDLPVYRCIRGTNSLEGGVHTNIIRKLSMYNASPKLTNCLLADYRLRHNTDVDSLNRYNILHKSHHNPWLIQGINHLRSELGLVVKGSYYDPDGNAIHIFPTGESFGLCPIPQHTNDHLQMIPNNVTSCQLPTTDLLVQDVLELCTLPMAHIRRTQANIYQCLSHVQGTKYPVTPIHTKQEVKDYLEIYNALKMYEKAKPNFLLMAQEWRHRTNTKNKILEDEQNPTYTNHYKIPEVIETYYNQSQNATLYTKSAKLPVNRPKIKAVADAVKPSNRPNVVILPPVPLSGLKNISPKKPYSTSNTSITVPTKRPVVTQITPTPIRPSLALAIGNIERSVNKKEGPK
ncbi:hypothetical protein MBANPS3_012261, partial [Mucor bainieri]